MIWHPGKVSKVSKYNSINKNMKSLIIYLYVYDLIIKYKNGLKNIILVFTFIGTSAYTHNNGHHIYIW